MNEFLAEIADLLSAEWDDDCLPERGEDASDVTRGFDELGQTLSLLGNKIEALTLAVLVTAGIDQRDLDRAHLNREEARRVAVERLHARLQERQKAQEEGT